MYPCARRLPRCAECEVSGAVVVFRVPTPRASWSPQPAALSPRSPSVLECEQTWGSAQLDAAQPRVLRCGEGAQGRRLRFTPQPGRFPGRAGIRLGGALGMGAVRRGHAAASFQGSPGPRTRARGASQRAIRGSGTAKPGAEAGTASGGFPENESCNAASRACS